jgi:hypothetical protein
VLEKRIEDENASGQSVGKGDSRVLCELGYSDDIAKALSAVKTDSSVKLSGVVAISSIGERIGCHPGNIL